MKRKLMYLPEFWLLVGSYFAVSEVAFVPLTPLVPLTLKIRSEQYTQDNLIDMGTMEAVHYDIPLANCENITRLLNKGIADTRWWMTRYEPTSSIKIKQHIAPELLAAINNNKEDH